MLGLQMYLVSTANNFLTIDNLPNLINFFRLFVPLVEYLNFSRTSFGIHIHF